MIPPVLSNDPPHSPVAPAALQAHFADGIRVRAAAGETVIMAGDDDRDVYLVTEGTVRFSLSSEAGRETIFSDASAGTILGELSAIDRRARSVVAEAVTGTELLRLRADRFLAVVTADPALSLWTMRMLASRLRDMTRRSFEMTSMSVERRVIAQLLRLSEEAGPHDGRVAIADFPTHEVLAATVGTHREAVTRTLRKLGRAGLLEQSGRTLTLLDRDRLEDLSDS